MGGDGIRVGVLQMCEEVVVVGGCDGSEGRCVAGSAMPIAYGGLP